MIFNKRTLAIIGITVGGVSVLANGILLYQKDFISEAQAQKIAYGRALSDCIEDRSSVLCNDIKVTDVSEDTAFPTDKGPDYWTFTYKLDKKGIYYVATEYVDLKGNILSL